MSGSGERLKSVGIPRSLMTFDLAPLMGGFLDELGVPVVVSRPTNKQIIERSLETAYADSCLQIKLLHGHVADLLESGVDFIIIPNAIRMGRKTGEEDQRYSCPLVQAAPYLIRATFQLHGKILDPIIDFSRGDKEVLNSFTEIAQRLGFSKRQGMVAARVGLQSQRNFEAQLQEAGKQVLSELEASPDKIGVVLLSRSYNSQDEGANLGIAKELQKLGVIPIPLDFLPLDRVNPKEITDRPYWNYERKILAGAKLIADHPQLFGLLVSNFGCGPNSIIQNVVEDIMGGKPLGQIEIDEHSAEAGIITRIESFVDTSLGYYRAGLRLSSDPSEYIRHAPALIHKGKNVFLPDMASQVRFIAAAMRANGVEAQVLPKSDDRSMELSRDVTNGKECLPYRDTLGVMLRELEKGNLLDGSVIVMASSYGPCRFGKYVQEQQHILNEREANVQIIAPVSNNGYSDIGLGFKFERLAWRGIVAGDHLLQLRRMTRPYEKEKGEADKVYDQFSKLLEQAIESRKPFASLMEKAAATFADLRDPALPPRPRVAINGEIYLRSNRFCNRDLEAWCEANGLEVEVAPMGEWVKYSARRNLDDALKDQDVKRFLSSIIRKVVVGYLERQVAASFKQVILEHEPSTEELLKASSLYIPSRCGSEAVLSLGSGIRQMKDPNYAGVISVMPHGCMPGGIVAAIGEQISREYDKPWISLTYDGFADKVNPERIADLAEQLKHRS